MSELPPVRIIATDTPISLRTLLKQNDVLEEVETGKRIVLLEGRSMTNLDHIVPPGKTLAVIAFHLIGGG